MKKRILKSEEKELLIKDLLPRIPTGLFVDVPDEEEPKELRKIVRWRIVFGRARSLEDCLDGLIPYLRPLSSMTEEEKEEFESLGWRVDELDGNAPWNNNSYNVFDGVDWLVSHHFDFRGLIQAGLALEAKEEMYDY